MTFITDPYTKYFSPFKACKLQRKKSLLKQNKDKQTKNPQKITFSHHILLSGECDT